MSRKIIPFIVAFILICLVMGVSGVFAFSGAVTAGKFGGKVAWSEPYSTAESMKVINLMGDDQDELFIQNTTNVTIFDGGGNVLFSREYQYPKTTLGDVNGDNDNKEDVIVFYLGNLVRSFNLGRVYAAQGRQAEACSIWRRATALRMDPGLRGQVERHLATCR